jgi:hypothetical protein
VRQVTGSEKSLRSRAAPLLKNPYNLSGIKSQDTTPMAFVTQRPHKMRRLLAIGLGVMMVGGCATGPATDRQQSRRLTLSYWQFDQTPEGWRRLADQRRFREAALLIETYPRKHPELSPNQRAMLHFHAAQLLGFEGDNAAALRHLDLSTVPNGSAGFPTRWNDYVAATSAFLKGDKATLLAARARMADGLSSDQDRTYLGVVDLLISRWGESYGEAYLSQMKSPKPSESETSR